MLGQRYRRWANIKTALYQRIVFAGDRHSVVDQRLESRHPNVSDLGPTLTQNLRHSNGSNNINPQVTGTENAQIGGGVSAGVPM